MIDVERLKSLLHLQPLAGEGGYFVQTYRAQDMIPHEALPSRYRNVRSVGTAIYYLLTPDTFSAVHRLPGDEIYHFYLGDPVELLQLAPDGTGKVQTLGPDLFQGMEVQLVVPHGIWQGSRLRAGGRFALMGTTMAPGFEYEDCELGQRAALLGSHSQFRDLIQALTRA